MTNESNTRRWLDNSSHDERHKIERYLKQADSWRQKVHPRGGGGRTGGGRLTGTDLHFAKLQKFWNRRAGTAAQLRMCRTPLNCTLLKIILAVQEGLQDLSSLTGGWNPNQSSPHSQAAAETPPPKVAPLPPAPSGQTTRLPWGVAVSFSVRMATLSPMGHAALSPSRRRAGVGLTQQRPCLCFRPLGVRISSIQGHVCRLRRLSSLEAKSFREQPA